MIRVVVRGLDAEHVAPVSSKLSAIEAVTDVMVTIGDENADIIITGHVDKAPIEAVLAEAGFSIDDYDPAYQPKTKPRGY